MWYLISVFCVIGSCFANYLREYLCQKYEDKKNLINLAFVFLILSLIIGLIYTQIKYFRSGEFDNDPDPITEIFYWLVLGFYLFCGICFCCGCYHENKIICLDLPTCCQCMFANIDTSILVSYLTIFFLLVIDLILAIVRWNPNPLEILIILFILTSDGLSAVKHSLQASKLAKNICFIGTVTIMLIVLVQLQYPEYSLSWTISITLIILIIHYFGIWEFIQEQYSIVRWIYYIFFGIVSISMTVGLIFGFMKDYFYYAEIIHFVTATLIMFQVITEFTLTSTIREYNKNNEYFEI